MPVIRQSRESGRFDLTAERARLSEPSIVQHDNQDVRSILCKMSWRYSPLVDGLLDRRPHLAAHRRRGKRQHILGNGRSCHKEQCHHPDHLESGWSLHHLVLFIGVGQFMPGIRLVLGEFFRFWWG